MRESATLNGMFRRLLVLLLLIAIAACTHTTSAPPPQPVSIPVAPVVAEGPWVQEARVPVSSTDPSVGPRDADVTLVIFSDFQCPFCARAHGYLGELKERYGARFRVVWKDYPLPAEMHPYALPAAITARVAFMAKGNDAFWRVATAFFINQADLSDTQLAGTLADAGVTPAAFQKYHEAAKAYVLGSHVLGDKLGVNGTPTFFLDGEKSC